MANPSIGQSRRLAVPSSNLLPQRDPVICQWSNPGVIFALQREEAPNLGRNNSGETACRLVGGLVFIDGRLLDPTTYRRPIRRVLRGKAGLDVALLPRDDDKWHESNWPCEGRGHPETVDPEGDSQLEDQAGDVDGIVTKAVGPAANNLGGRLIAGDWRAYGANLIYSIPKLFRSFFDSLPATMA